MKIAYVVRQIDAAGGRERVLVNKANYLAKVYGYEVFIITMFQEKDGSFIDIDKAIQIRHLNLVRKELFGGAYWVYWKYVKEALERHLMQITPDVTVSMWWGIEFKIFPFLRDGSRKILEFHFSHYSRYRMANEDGVSLLSKARLLATRWFENILIDRYDKFIVLTNEDKLSWKKEVVVIPNPLSFTTSKQSSCVNPVVIAAGRLTEQKGFDRLIQIWSMVERRCGEWVLLIYGDGEDKEKLEKLIRERHLERVSLMPTTTDLKAKLLDASIFVMTSRYEGSPLVLTEAMQCGLPVVSYDFKCGPRDSVEDGVTGFLVKDGDELDFCDKLCDLIYDRDLRLRIGAAAKRESTEKFSEDAVMRKWQELFKEVGARTRVR